MPNGHSFTERDAFAVLPWLKRASRRSGLPCHGVAAIEQLATALGDFAVQNAAM